jgi:hypothetical protein
MTEHRIDVRFVPVADNSAAAANLPEMSMQLLGRQINPTFENDTYVVLPSPSEVACHL